MSRANPRFRRTNPPLPGLAGLTVAEFTYQGQLEAQMTLNTFYYQTNVQTITQAQWNTLISNIHTALSTTYRAMMTPEWGLQFAKLTMLSGGSLAPNFLSFTPLLAGTAPAGHSPSTVSVVIGRQTAIQGQHGRGRLYIPAPPTTWVSFSSLGTPGAYTAFLTPLLATVTDGVNTWTPCLVSRTKTSPKIINGSGVLITAAVRAVLGTTRRRRLGRGK